MAKYEEKVPFQFLMGSPPRAVNAREWGSRLKQVRKKLGLLQNDFAAQLGISGAYVSELEGGTKAPSKTLLLLLEHKLGVNPRFLAEGKGPVLREPEKTVLHPDLLEDEDILDIVRYVKADKDARKLIHSMAKKFFGLSALILSSWNFLV